MTHTIKVPIREKLLTVEVESEVFDYTEVLPDYTFTIESVSFNGEPYEITDAERGEIYRICKGDAIHKLILEDLCQV